VQIDLRQDIALISDAIASRVDEVASSITGALEERSEHITRALSSAGDNMIIALGERGGDLLDRLEEASTQTAASVLDASEKLTASLNFKTGHVHEEFADRPRSRLSERAPRQDHLRIRAALDRHRRRHHVALGRRRDQRRGSDRTYLRLAEEFQRQPADGTRHRGAALSEQIDEAGNRLADRVLTSGDKAGEALDVTVSTLVAKVVSQTESAHETLSNQIGLFDGLVKEQGNEARSDWRATAAPSARSSPAISPSSTAP
jgi:DNA anti-recombination protein RmuC